MEVVVDQAELFSGSGDDASSQRDSETLQTLAVPRDVDESLERAACRTGETAPQTECPNLWPGLGYDL